MVGSVLSFVFYDPLFKTQMFAKTQLAEGGKFGYGCFLPGDRDIRVTHSGPGFRRADDVICVSESKKGNLGKPRILGF